MPSVLTYVAIVSASLTGVCWCRHSQVTTDEFGVRAGHSPPGGRAEGDTREVTTSAIDWHQQLRICVLDLPDETDYTTVLTCAAHLAGHVADWDERGENLVCPCGRVFADDAGNAEESLRPHVVEAAVAYLIEAEVLTERAAGVVFIMVLRGFEGSWALLDEVSCNSLSADLVRFGAAPVWD